MIGLSGGPEVHALLDRMCNQADRLREVLICSPFVDEALDERLAKLATAITSAGARLLLITTPEVARPLRLLLAGQEYRRTTVSTPRRRLHAKAYVSVARRARESEAIITSANLTKAGLASNIELGVRVVPVSDAGRLLFDQTCRFVRALA
ncbi:MAG: hypothetical protein E7812_02230 [Phenylobacterium sp.]|nr:MAG: hypothetical protein E7812_02230 [Phenylobacterium sp.]